MAVGGRVDVRPVSALRTEQGVNGGPETPNPLKRAPIGSRYKAGPASGEASALGATLVMVIQPTQSTQPIQPIPGIRRTRSRRLIRSTAVGVVVLLALAAPLASQLKSETESPTPPSDPAPGFKAIAHDHLLPKTALAVVSLSPFEEHRDELAKTGFYKLLKPAWDALPKEAVGKLLGGSWVTQDLENLLSRGLTIAMTGVGVRGIPTWLVAVNLGDSERDFQKAMKAQMEGLRRSGFQVRKEVFRRGELWILEIPDSGLEVIYTIRNGTVIAGSQQKEVELAIDRLLGDKAESLADSQFYRSFCAHQQKEGQPLFSFYLQPFSLVSQLTAMVPGNQQIRARQALGQLELHKMRDLAFTLRPGGGQLHEFFWLRYPSPRSGLLAVLLGSPRKVDPQIASRVSPDVVYASVYHLNFRQVYESLVSLSAAFSLQGAQQINMFISNLETRARVSLTKDVLDMLSDEVIVQQWRVPRSSTANMAVTVRLRDEPRFRNGLEQLARLVNVQRYNVRGTTAYSFDLPVLPQGLTPYLMAYRGHLVFATTNNARDSVMANLDQPGNNPRFAKIVASLGGNPTSVSWGDCSELGQELTSTLGTQFGKPLTDHRLADALQDIGGEMVAVSTETPEGFLVRSSSPYGNMYLCVALAFGLRSVVQDMPGVTQPQQQKPSQTETQKISAILKQIADAQRLYKASTARDHNKNGVGEYGTIRELITTQCLAGDLLERNVHEDKYGALGFYFKVMLPAGPDNQELRFAIVAWPEKRKRGVVLAITEAGLPQVNSIIAQAEGLDECDPRDLFEGGGFDAPLVEGWRPVATASEIARARLLAAADAEKAAQEENLAHYKAVVEAEKTKQVTPEAIKALEATNPDIAARAAYTMGMLKAKNAVPSLCELAVSHEVVQVRRQAMAALTKIRDPRSAATSIRVLTDPDATIRAYAATNLGRLEAKAGLKPLLNLLSGPVEGTGADHVAALLALADIGDPRSLTSVATAVRSQDPKISEALTYLFQKVSPTMDPEAEVKPLLIALNSKSLMLRRYVIQRLGVLKNPTTITPLENRLAKEDRQLQPLISVSLNAIRGHAVENISLTMRAEAWLAKAEQRWQKLTSARKIAVVGSVAAVFLLFLVFLAWRRHKRRRLAAETWARMVSPAASFMAAHPGTIGTTGTTGTKNFDDDEPHYHDDLLDDMAVDDMAVDDDLLADEDILSPEEERLLGEHADEQYGLHDDGEAGGDDDWDPLDDSGAESLGRFTED